MDGEETNVAVGSPAALAKAALASVMAKPNGEVVPPTVVQLQAELAALKAKLGAPSEEKPPKPSAPKAVKVDKKAAKLAAKEAKAAAKGAKLAAKADKKAAKLAAKAAKLAAKADKKTVKQTKAAVPPEPTSMTVEEAQAFVATFAGKKGRRPAAFYVAQKLAGVSVEPVAKPAKSAKAAKVVKKVAKVALVPSEPKSLTVEEAKAFVATFAGKKGRRPAAFYAAQKIAGVSVEPKATKAVKPEKLAAKAAKAAKKEAKLVAKAEKALAKGLKKKAKEDAKAAKLAAKAEKKAAKPVKVKDASAKPTPSTGQSGSTIKDLTAEDLNDKETAIMLALGTEGHRTEKAIKDLATECFPNKKKVQANSWTRNGLRRLVRAKFLEKDSRGVFKQSLEGRVIAKILEVMKDAKK